MDPNTTNAHLVHQTEEPSRMSPSQECATVRGKQTKTMMGSVRELMSSTEIIKLSLAFLLV